MSVGFNDDSEARLLGSGIEDVEHLEVAETLDDGSDEYYELPPAIKSRSLIWAVISVLAGILSFTLCFFHYVGLGLAAVAFVTAMVSRKNLGFFEKYSIMGIMLGIIGFVCSVFSMIANMLGLFVF